VVWRTSSQDPDAHLATALDHAEDRGFLLRQCAASACPFEAIASSFAAFFLRRMAALCAPQLVPRNDVNFIALDNTLETRCRLVFDNAVSELKGHRLHIIFVEV